MQPDITKVTINNNEKRILELLNDLVFNPRIKALQWSSITKQTPNLKIGYPGQHLASLIMGMEGERTAARGNDICDGTEIKACNRIDQLDKCKNCGENVMRIESSCPVCDSENIKRAKDSKWLFGIKSIEELRVLTVQTNRVFLVLFDYSNFNKNDFNTIRIQAFEIWNNSERGSKFRELMEAYYYNIYLFHIENNPKKTPAPYNLWPDYFPFYQCNPIKVFNCTITNANVNPILDIDLLIEPTVNRSTLPSIIAPVSILKINELRLLENAIDADVVNNLNENFTIENFREAFSINVDSSFKSRMIELLKGIDENLRSYIPLREMNPPRVAGTQSRADRS